MMRKVGLYITTLLHDITREGYGVSFQKDHHGMLRIEFTKEHVAEFYEQYHCGFPGASREKLETDIIDSLIRFKTDFSVPNLIDSEGDLPPAA